MGYYIDLRSIDLDTLKMKLLVSDLLPSQKILLERIDERFSCLKEHDINNLMELKNTLKTKTRVQSFSKLSRLPEKYLIVLRREVNSYHPQARKIKDFPCIDDRLKHGLDQISIRTTVDLFHHVATQENRRKLINELGIIDEEALLLARITDVSRLRYVNQTFATLLILSQYDTVEKIQKVKYELLYDELIRINSAEKIYRGNIGLKDMKFLVNDSHFFPLVIQY